MTDGNPGPEEAPAPPTSTGWSENDDAHDDDLAPPFVPGAAEPQAPTEPEPTPEPGTAPEEEAAEAFPFETAWDVEEDAAAEEPEEDAFPVDAFDIEGEEASWGTEPGRVEGTGVEAAGPESEPEGEDAAGPETQQSAEIEETRQMEAARDVAGRLEEMARRLRDQGPQAARAEIDSSDRFTSLLAGLLAGYLAGKE